MFIGAWEQLAGSVLEGRYRLERLICAGERQAEFLACPVDGSEPEQALSITVIEPDEESSEQLLAAIETARQLRHPCLLRIVGGGRCSTPFGTLLFVATEQTDGSLAQALESGELAGGSAEAIAADLSSALGYVHSRGLVALSIEPDTIVRTEGHWKLADLGRLQRPEEFAPAAGMPAPEYMPPEAESGPLAPGWDVWALGRVLQLVLAKQGDTPEPAPLNAIVRGCLEPDPCKRLSAREIGALIEKAQTPAAAPARIRSRVVWALACAGVALVVVLAILWRGGRQVPTAAAKPPAAALSPVLTRAPRPSPFSGAVDAPQPKPQRRVAATQPVEPAEARVTPAVERKAAPVATGEEQTGRANYFGDNLNGQLTANGETFSNEALTAAHRNLPFGTRVRVTNLSNSKSVVVRVNDRAPLRQDYIIQVTRAAAGQLGFLQAGSARVKVEIVR